MRDKEYILFCDESDRHGKYYSNFYGGVIVGSSQYQRITDLLNNKKAELNLYQEVKWAKVTEQYLSKYEELIRVFFEEIVQGNLRIRIMFRQNAHLPQGLSREQVDWEYYLLYYQFVKHGFGLEHVGENVRLRLYFDTFPDTAEKSEQFKGFLLGLTKTAKWKSVEINKEDITEVHSHDHVLLQCLDIVLGSMSFRLNDKYKEFPQGSRRRGKRTIAKEKLYKSILSEIRQIRPGFNIGVSTRIETVTDRWRLPYMHWAFIPNNESFDASLTKSRRKK
ncbi:MAG: DUF3800 domain-containing protein [Chloroflexota bacterium]